MIEHKVRSNSGFSELFYIVIVAIIITFAFFLIYTKQNSNKIIINSPLVPSVTTMPTQTEELFCGGITGTSCPDGYNCQLDGSYPDAGGKCIKGSSQKKYSCPNNEWVDCMPKVDQPPSFQCEKQYLNWAKINCPNFKGAAL